jgi:hypothetical protein
VLSQLRGTHRRSISMWLSLTYKTSFEKAKSWVRELQRQADPSIVIILVGNKADLSANRKTSREMGEAYAQEEGLLFTEASAKDGTGVEELFMAIGASSVDIESEIAEMYQHVNCRLLHYRNVLLQVRRVSRYKDRPNKDSPPAPAEYVGPISATPVPSRFRLIIIYRYHPPLYILVRLPSSDPWFLSGHAALRTSELGRCMMYRRNSAGEDKPTDGNTLPAPHDFVLWLEHHRDQVTRIRRNWPDSTCTIRAFSYVYCMSLDCVSRVLAAFAHSRVVGRMQGECSRPVHPYRMLISGLSHLFATPLIRPVNNAPHG